MEQSLFYGNGSTIKNSWLLPVALMAVFFGWLIGVKGIAIEAMLIVVPFVIGFVILVFLKPRAGLVFFIIYCFIVPGISKHIEGPQFGLGQDALLLLTWLAIIFHRSKQYRYRHLNNDLVWLCVVWLVITVLEIINPEHPSLIGWFYEMRSATLYQVLSIPLAFFIFNKKKDIDFFLNLVIVASLLGALYGIKQLFIGTDAAENRWLAAGAYKTHILNGKLRIFSFYTEAAQFGCSMAQIAIMGIILATGPYSFTKKICYAIIGMIAFYAMLISGTRSAMFVLVGGGFLHLILSKKIRILLIGSIIGIAFFGVLKFTSIGSGNAQIVRLRTSVDPDDPSFQVRLMNQLILKDFLSSRPFGAGVGVLGTWGVMYNQDKFISTIPPDSLYVKVWAMYGIIGFLIWFGFMMFIVGKSAGIIWKTRDPVLKNKLSALSAGATGILLCSYGNEVMNQMPSSIIVYVSWVFIWLSPRWDTPEPKPVTV